ncbi:B-S glucosidase 44, putative [Theobroma cacao]|uniref:B-S glucosidase 44, putative n=1 Tax=Theobroma cacao TaxID=3641 RepID=A0A061FVV4_THECC|nr:B-S glucosidase 44, putative [Theobroma cacao]
MAHCDGRGPSICDVFVKIPVSLQLLKMRVQMSFLVFWVRLVLLALESFPKGFVFGTATSAYQFEGMAHCDGRGPSICDVFVKIPGIVAKNGTGEVSVDQYHRYKEDVDLMANLNFDAYRFSISWSRIFPDGTGKVNWKGVAYYNRLIDSLLQRVASHVFNGRAAP